MSKLKNYGKKIIDLDMIEKLYKIDEYLELYKLVSKLIDDERLAIVKSSGGNGKNPTLYKKYKIIEKTMDYSELEDEISYKLHTKFNLDYYKSHLNKYKEHRQYILNLSDFFYKYEELLKVRISMNERSFQIWGREKFIQKEQGKTILKNLGIDLEVLNYYDTSEPLAYYSISKKIPQNILILENKDTYYTMRRHLINGGKEILNNDISTVIYGGGKNIIRAFKDYKISVEDYLSDEQNRILYFGDLDYEGIIIYEGFFKNYGDKYNIEPFVDGYKKLIEKAKGLDVSLPTSKEGQNKNIGDILLKTFDTYYKEKIEETLKEGLYIPQEIINIMDL